MDEELEVDETLEEESDEIASLENRLTELAIENRAQHEQILIGVTTCLKQLENLSATENPVTQAMLTEITSLKTEIAEVKGMLISLQTSLTALSHSRQEDRQPNESSHETELPPVENPSEQSQERSTDEPKPEETRRKRRIL